MSQGNVSYTQYESDLDRTIDVNGKPMPIGYWNLIISIRDVSLFTKGIRPHRRWRLKHVKAYFGVTGSTSKILTELHRLKADADAVIYGRDDV
jgi:hypothetical protein